MTKAKPILTWILTTVFLIAMSTASLTFLAKPPSPQPANATDKKQDIYTVLVLDVGSEVNFRTNGIVMYTASTPVEYTKKGASAFCNYIDGTSMIAIVSYSDEVTVVSEFSKDKDRQIEAIGTLEVGKKFGNMADALQTADSLLSEAPEDAVKNIVILNSGSFYCKELEDGTKVNYQTEGRYNQPIYDRTTTLAGTNIYAYEAANYVYATARELHDKGIKIYSIGVFNNYPQDQKTIDSLGGLSLFRAVSRDIANTSGMYYEVAYIQDIAEIFIELAKDLNGEKGLFGDINCDGKIDAIDSSLLLEYYSYLMTVQGDSVSLEEYLEIHYGIIVK